MSGTLTIIEFPVDFSGQVNEQGRLTGQARSEDGSGLDADLTLSGAVLTGRLTATEAITCNDGTTSVTTYQVRMVKE